jgi:zinc-ribbon domain/FHA domain
MNCPNCGKPVRVGAAFCGECGAKLAVVAADPGAPLETPVGAVPLRRPPPPPEDDVPEAVVVAESVALLVPPPPPPGVPKEVEIVPFGTTEDLPVRETSVATITISPPPPGIQPPPTAMVEDVIGAPPSPASVVAPTPSVAPPESLDETRVSVRRNATTRWRLVLPDARQVEVSGALLVGRDPSANPRWPAAAFLTISDAGNSISKTHSVFEADAEGLWVMDLDSTNGVVVIQPDGVELDLSPNVRTLVLPGADVELGDCIIQVEKD